MFEKQAVAGSGWKLPLYQFAEGKHLLSSLTRHFCLGPGFETGTLIGHLPTPSTTHEISLVGARLKERVLGLVVFTPKETVALT